MASQGPQDGGFREINVTPLVDVMLVLLIIFMITAPLMASKLDVDLPTVDGVPTEASEQDVVVVVTRDGVWHVQDAPDAVDAAVALRTRLARSPRRRVVIQADGHTYYQHVAQAITEVRNAGAASVDLWVTDRGEG